MGGVGKVMDCFYWLRLWIAMPFGFLVAERWSERVLLWLALSAGAILLQRVRIRRTNMSCCGKERQQLHSLSEEAQTLRFRYVGMTAVTVRGAGSGKIYVVNKPGSIIEVDSRDQEMFAAMRTMQQL
jgi:hypothetical protein